MKGSGLVVDERELIVAAKSDLVMAEAGFLYARLCLSRVSITVTPLAVCRYRYPQISFVTL